MADCRKFYFVRHGLTDWNAEGRFQGRNDIHLNAEGIKQAEIVGMRLEKSSAVQVITSPLSRAKQAAEIIAGSKRKVVVWEELTEQCFGAWEKLKLTDVKADHKERYEAWRKGRADVPGGESEKHIFARAQHVIEKLSEIEDEETIIVSHGGLLRLVFLAWLKSDYSSIFWHVRLDNCSITTAEIRNGKFALCSINDTMHFRVSGENAVRNLPLV